MIASPTFFSALIVVATALGAVFALVLLGMLIRDWARGDLW